VKRRAGYGEHARIQDTRGAPCGGMLTIKAEIYGLFCPKNPCSNFVIFRLLVILGSPPVILGSPPVILGSPPCDFRFAALWF